MMCGVELTSAKCFEFVGYMYCINICLQYSIIDFCYYMVKPAFYLSFFITIYRYISS